MRIGMMADTYKPHVSGVTHYIDINKQYLERARHEVFVFTFGEKNCPGDEPRVVRSPGLPLAGTGYYLALQYSRTARQLLESMDLVHVHHPFLSGRLALRYCRPRGIPILFTNHTRYDLYARAYLPLVPGGMSLRLLQAYMPSFCRSVDLVVSPSQGMEQILRQLGVRSPIEVVPNGVDLSRFHEARAMDRTTLGFKKNDILLIYTGRVAPEKNLEFLLDAFANLVKQVSKVRLLILGGGQTKLVRALQLQAKQLGVKEHVRFLGLMPYTDVPGYLAMCNAFVTASVSEVHPLSVIEAMGTGLPVVGIESPGISDTVQNGVTGLLSAQDKAAFTHALRRLCSDPELAARMGQAARKASAAYAIERTTQVMLSHYESLVHSARARELATKSG